ncbi:MAG: hypothetical protein WCS89_02190 [Candidatus Paceibacterota bacterium]
MSKSIIALAAEVNLSKVKLETEKMASGEVAVGVMSNDLKRLFYLYSKSVDLLNGINQKIREKMAEHAESHKKGNPRIEKCAKHSAEMDKIVADRNEIAMRHGQLHNIFWGAVRIEFPELLDKCTIKICENFTVTYKKESTPAGVTEEMLAILKEAIQQAQQKHKSKSFSQ